MIFKESLNLSYINPYLNFVYILFLLKRWYRQGGNHYYKVALSMGAGFKMSPYLICLLACFKILKALNELIFISLCLSDTWFEEKLLKGFQWCNKNGLIESFEMSPCLIVWADPSTFTSYPDLIQRLAIKGIRDVSSDTSRGGSF